MIRQDQTLPIGASRQAARDPGRLVSPRVQSRLGSSGTAAGGLGNHALRLITGNSFRFPSRSGLSQRRYLALNKPASGTTCVPCRSCRPTIPLWRLLRKKNGVLRKRDSREGSVLSKLVETREIRRWQLRPVVSSDRRIAVEIPAARFVTVTMQNPLGACW